MKLDTIYPIGFIVLVVLVIVLTIAFPFRSLRATALDSTMSSALSEVSAEIKSYTDTNGKLPDDLSQLSFDESQPVVTNNPGIVNNITYNKNDSNGAMSFNLCATFKTEQKAETNVFSYLGGSSTSLYGVSYTEHPKGYHCFAEESVSSYTNYQDYYDQYYNMQELNTTTEDSYYN